MTRILLDYNATTPPLPEVVQAMKECSETAWANPGSRHAEGRAARKALEAARESLAHRLGAHPDEVIFTSGGTESINMTIAGFASLAPPEDEPWRIATTAGEHPASREAIRFWESRGFHREIIPVDSQGLLRESEFERLPWSRIRIVTVILAHNETGVIQPVSRLAEYCRNHRIPLHLDAVQAVGKIPVHFHDLDATALSLGAHKFYGPRGIGALLLKRGVRLPPLLRGGHQETERRAGTEPVALAVGMARALEVWRAESERVTQQLAERRDRLQRALLHRCAPAIVHGAEVARLPNTLNIAFPGVDGEALLVALDLEGVACSLGSACASGAAEPAPVLVAMGCPREVYSSSIRFSLGRFHSEEEIDDAADRICRVVSRLRRFGERT